MYLINRSEKKIAPVCNEENMEEKKRKTSDLRFNNKCKSVQRKGFSNLKVLQPGRSGKTI